ncbi:MAG: DUF4446 family protein [bacterium]|nr:DUF4446 family protein [bacterium]
MLENYTLYVYIAFAAAILLLAFRVITLEVRLRKFFAGKKAKDLEGVMAGISEELGKINALNEETKKYLKTVEERLQNSIQKVGMVRFNPFENSGSNQSFAIALLDEKGNGVVISSLYSREKVNVYAKPINNRQSEYALSKEEKEAINIAVNKNGQE